MTFSRIYSLKKWVRCMKSYNIFALKKNNGSKLTLKLKRAMVFLLQEEVVQQIAIFNLQGDALINGKKGNG